MTIEINGGGKVQWYVLPTSVYATKNNDFPMEYRYIVLIFQHALEDILNVSQRFTNLLHQPTKPQGIVGQFTNRPKGNKEAYNYIDAFIHRLKEEIVEPIATRYIR